MNLYASINTRSNDLTSTGSSVMSEKEKEEKLQKVRDVYNNKKIRKDSLLAKANMVKDFNEQNNK